jgi:hypothetical protein
MIIKSALQLSLLGTLMLTSACAADVSHRSAGHSASQTPLVSQEQARQLAFSYRRKAQDLRELARQLETEVYFSSGRVNSNTDSRQDRLVQVGTLRSAAEEADELARHYQRQVPHSQLQ